MDYLTMIKLFYHYLDGTVRQWVSVVNTLPEIHIKHTLGCFTMGYLVIGLKFKGYVVQKIPK